MIFLSEANLTCSLCSQTSLTGPLRSGLFVPLWPGRRLSIQKLILPHSGFSTGVDNPLTATYAKSLQQLLNVDSRPVTMQRHFSHVLLRGAASTRLAVGQLLLHVAGQIGRILSRLVHENDKRLGRARWGISGDLFSHVLSQADG